MFRRVIAGGLLGVVLAAGAVGLRASEGSEAMKAVVAAYLGIQAQLAADKTDTIKAQAHAIGEQAGRMQQAGTAIVAAAGEVEKAADLKTTRDAFGALSDAVIAAARADGWTDVSGLKLAYCPMVKRSWLQAQATLQNPYYGKSMAACGEFKTMP